MKLISNWRFKCFIAVYWRVLLRNVVYLWAISWSRWYCLPLRKISDKTPSGKNTTKEKENEYRTKLLTSLPPGKRIQNMLAKQHWLGMGQSLETQISEFLHTKLLFHLQRKPLGCNQIPRLLLFSRKQIIPENKHTVIQQFQKISVKYLKSWPWETKCSERVDADPHHGEANPGTRHSGPKEKVQHHQQNIS